MLIESRRLNRWLCGATPAAFNLFAATAAFSTYFCMYAFRKPVMAAQFQGQMLWNLDLKTVLVIGQIVGYTLSKYLGIRVCSEAGPAHRARLLIILVVLSECSLILLAVSPPFLMVFAIFLNGLPLGMVWGLVVGFLEGRRTSEFLMAGLSCSFIVSSASVKDVGRLIMTHWHVSEYWMPACTGLLFLPAFLVSVWLLNHLPQPDAEDARARVRRSPMGALERRAFVREFFPGLVALLVCYFGLTAYRDFRDNYGVEILRQMGHLQNAAVFTRIELPVAFGVMAALATLSVFRENRSGLAATFAMMISGVLMVGGATHLWSSGHLGGLAWMTLTGLGSYIAYVPFNSMLFDRLIAATGVGGTAVFAIYLADSVGYTGSILVQLFRDLVRPDMSRLAFFHAFSFWMSIVGVICLASACVYFNGGIARRAKPVVHLPEA